MKVVVVLWAVYFLLGGGGPLQDGGGDASAVAVSPRAVSGLYESPTRRYELALTPSGYSFVHDSVTREVKRVGNWQLQYGVLAFETCQVAIRGDTLLDPADCAKVGVTRWTRETK